MDYRFYSCLVWPCHLEAAVKDMIDLAPFKDVTIAVFGLARSGLVAAEALQKGGAYVWAWDDSEDRRQAAAARGITLVDLYREDLGPVKTLVLSPGVPLHHPKPHPVVLRARSAGCEIIGDIDLLGRVQKTAKYIGITGTNGKSTTTALIGHILKKIGRTAEVGGNLGIPVLSLKPLGPDDIYVLEMSSYQLDLTSSIVFDVSVLLNISSDHLDRHGDMAGYAAAKEEIFKGQGKTETAIIGIDDPICSKIHDQLRAKSAQKIIPVSTEKKPSGGIYVENGVIVDDTEGFKKKAVILTDIETLPGHHNWQNAAAAYAAIRALGTAPAEIAQAMHSYPGLSHRQERIAYVDDVLYINDSKATNVDSAARALSCYSNIYWIAGGRGKDGGFEPLEPFLPHVRSAYLIGEAAELIADFLTDKVTYHLCGNLVTAVQQAHQDALTDHLSTPVVLLSPACASFDQFKDFEDRGNRYRAIVAALPGQHRSPQSEGIAA